MKESQAANLKVGDSVNIKPVNCKGVVVPAIPAVVSQIGNPRSPSKDTQLLLARADGSLICWAFAWDLV